MWTLAVGGGVAANSRLRQLFQEEVEKEGLFLHLPSKKFCTDNAAMIACAGYRHWFRGERSDLTLNASTRQPLRGIRGGKSPTNLNQNLQKVEKMFSKGL